MNEKLILNLSITNRLIVDTELSIQCIKHSPLYEYIKEEEERRDDLNDLYLRLKALYNKQYDLLESLKGDVVKMQVTASYKQRELNLTTNK